MQRGIDIINAMMAPLDELHARREREAIATQIAEAKDEFEQRVTATGGDPMLWLGPVHWQFLWPGSEDYVE